MLAIRGQPPMDAHPSEALANGAERLLQLIEAERESVRLSHRHEMDRMQASNKEFQHNAYLVATELKRKASVSAREAETWKEEAAKARQEAYAAQQELQRLRGAIATEKWNAHNREVWEGTEGAITKVEEPQTPTIPPSIPASTDAAHPQDEVAHWKSKCASLVSEKEQLTAAHKRERLQLVKKTIALSMAVRLFKDRCQTLQQRVDENGVDESGESNNSDSRKHPAEPGSRSSPDDGTMRARMDDTMDATPTTPQPSTS